MKTYLLLMTFVLSSMIVLVGCEEETLSEEITETSEQVKDDVTDAVDNAKNDVEDLCEEAKEKVGADDTDC